MSNRPTAQELYYALAELARRAEQADRLREALRRLLARREVNETWEETIIARAALSEDP